MNLRTLILLILGMPKTIFFNFHYFKFKDAIKLPVLVSHNVILNEVKGKVILGSRISTGMIKYGFFESPFLYKQNIKSYWNVTGSVTFRGIASLGKGTKIRSTGDLIFGNNIKTSGNMNIDCQNKISFGDGNLVGWDCTFMDDDNHTILNENGMKESRPKEIISGDRVWYGMKCTILKGVQLGNDVVIAANSCVLKKFEENNCIIGGYPAKLLKKNITWHK